MISASHFLSLCLVLYTSVHYVRGVVSVNETSPPPLASTTVFETTTATSTEISPWSTTSTATPTTEAHSTPVSTTSPAVPTTTQYSICLHDQPCINGSCIDLPSGDYECNCTSQYKGRNCSQLLTPCELESCPANSSCRTNISDNTVYCVCEGNWTGKFCNQTDQLVRCADDMHVKYDVKKSGSKPIKCYPKVTLQNNTCFDPDDRLVYSLKQPSSIFTLQPDGCLYVDSNKITKSDYCLTFVATEENDVVNRPWRNDSFQACVKFNEPPSFFFDEEDLTINAKHIFRQGDRITSLPVNDSFVVHNFTFNILEVLPLTRSSFFYMDGPHLKLKEDLEDITTEKIVVVVQVADNGIPNLTDTTTLNITLVNNTVICSVPNIVKINAQNSTNAKISSMTCDGGLAGISFNVSQSSGLPLVVGSDGAVSLQGSVNVGIYPVVVTVTKEPFGKSHVHFSVHIGLPPQCKESVPGGILIEESEPVGDCRLLYEMCSSLPGLRVKFLNPNNATGFFSLQVVGQVNISGCLNSSLYAKKMVKTHFFQIEVFNEFGSQQLPLKLAITKVNLHQPQFISDYFTWNIPENQTLNSEVGETPATDADYDVTLRYSLSNKGAFAYKSEFDNQLLLKEKLNATEKHRYSFLITVYDGPMNESDTRSSVGNVTIFIEDINEAPVCGTPPIFTVDATAVAGYVIGNVSCYDVDRKKNFNKLTYSLQSRSSRATAIADLFSVSGQGEITLLKNMTAATDMYKLDILVTDGGGLTTYTAASVLVNRNFAPVCTGHSVSADIKDETKCFYVSKTCIDPLGGSLQYTVVGGTGAQIIGLNTSDSSGLKFCTKSSIRGNIGTYSLELDVSNGFNSTKIMMDVTITEVNDPPVFVAAPYVITLSEKAPVGVVVLKVFVTDPDTQVPNNIVSYSLEGNNDFEINSASGVILTKALFNASATDVYEFNVTAKDGGGAAVHALVRVNIEDVNDPPKCEKTNLAQVSISLILAPGSNILQLNCWDWDVKSTYNDIVYEVQGPMAAVFGFRENGTMELMSILPRDINTSFPLTVFVYDAYMKSTGNLTGKFEVTIPITVNKNFPPKCSTVSITETWFENVSIGKCIGRGVTCNDPTGGAMTIKSTTGVGNELEVKFNQDADTKTLSLNVCTKLSLQNKIKTYKVDALVTNGFGDTKVTWTIKVEDVNEPPFFTSNKFNVTISESTSIGSSILNLGYSDPDTLSQFKTVNISAQALSFGKGEAGTVDFISNCCFYVTSKLNATDKNLVQFNVTLKDGGNLTTSVIVSIHIVDQNEAPVCAPRLIIKDIPLLIAVNKVIGLLSCYDSDLDPNNKELTYSDNSDYFKILSKGEVAIAKALPRSATVHNVLVTVSDKGNPPLSANSVTVTVTVNNKVKPDCNPQVKYPSVWVKGQCVSIVMQCTDPTLVGTSHLKYQTNGTFGGGFTIQNPQSGQYKLCYNLVKNGNFDFIVTVTNGLADYVYNQPLLVKYEQSNPVFTQNEYSITVTENVVPGNVILSVQASTQSANGTIVYSISGGTWSNITSIFQVNSATGEITTRVGLRIYATLTLTIEIQALNDFSLLTKTASVKIAVSDVNEAPKCSLTSGGTITAGVDDKEGVTVFSAKCSDVDVKADFKTLTASYVSNPSVSGLFKLTNKDGAVSLVTSSLWPVKNANYDVTVKVSDSGNPPLFDSLTFKINVNLLPPAPILTASPTNSSAINIQWNYVRADYFDVTQKFKLKVASGKQTPDFDMEMGSSTRQRTVVGLKAETLYSINLEAVTDYGSTNANPITIATPAVPILTRNLISVKLTGETFKQTLYDSLSFDHVTLKKYVEKNFQALLQNKTGFVKNEVTSFRDGSVIADVIITKNQLVEFSTLSTIVQNAVQTGWIGQMPVDQNYLVVQSGDGYIQIASLVKNITNVYQNDVLSISCTADIVGNVGSIESIWRRNGSVIRPTAASRWKIVQHAVDSNNKYQRKFSLVIQSVKDKDTGDYSCTIKNDKSLTDTKSISVFILAQPVVIITPRTLTVDEGQDIKVTCRVSYPVAPHFAFFTWYRNGVMFDAQTFEAGEALIQGSYVESITKTNIRQSVQYSCEARNNAGIGNRAASDIRVITTAEKNKACPAVNDTYGFVWQLTAAGSKDILPCLTGYSGTAVRSCSDAGQWLEADYSDCIRDDIAKIASETDSMVEGVEVTTTEESLSQLANLTSADQGSLQTGDVDTTVNILSNVNVINEDNVTKVTDNSIEAFAQITDNLLDDKNRPVWQWKKQNKKKDVSQLMKAATNFVKISSKKESLTPTVKVKNNIVIQVNRVDTNKDIEFPTTNAQNPEWLKSNTRIKIKAAALKSIAAGQQKLAQSGVFYKDLAPLLPTTLYTDSKNLVTGGKLEVNSYVVDLSLGVDNVQVDPPVELTFEHLQTNYSGARVAYWDFDILKTENGAWSSKGCVVVATSDTQTSCECNHMTNFALLMSPGKTPVAHELPLSIISAVGIALSMLFLLLTVGMYFAFWRYIRSDRSTILMNLCVALILGYIIFLAGVTRTENKDVCTAIAALLHYIYLVVFFIMLAEGIEIGITVLYVFSTRSRLHWLLPLSWILPAVIVGISLGVTKTEGYGSETSCWLSVDSGVLWAFVAPALLIILVNTVIFIFTMRAMFNTQTMLTKTTKKQAKTGLRSMCVMLPLLGVSWILGVFSVNEDLVIFQYVFAILNTLQGFFIFLFHCLLNRQLKDAIKHNRRRKRSMAEFSKSTSQTQTVKQSQRKDQPSLEQKQNNIDVEKKENPFLEADKQVQEILDKIHKSNGNTSNDIQDDREKNVIKESVVGLEDIKIVNLFSGSDSNITPSSTTSNQNRVKSDVAESKKSGGDWKDSQYQRYDKLVLPGNSGPKVGPTALPTKDKVHHQLSSTSGSTDHYSLSNTSSRTSDDLEIFLSMFDMSGIDFSDNSSVYALDRENRTRIDKVYSFSKESDSQGSKNKVKKRKEQLESQIRENQQKELPVTEKKISDSERSDSSQSKSEIQVYAPSLQKYQEGVKSDQNNAPQKTVPEPKLYQPGNAQGAAKRQYVPPETVAQQRRPNRQETQPDHRIQDQPNSKSENFLRNRTAAIAARQRAPPEEVQTRPQDNRSKYNQDSQSSRQPQPQHHQQRQHPPSQRQQTTSQRQQPQYEVVQKSQKKGYAKSSSKKDRDREKPRSDSRDRDRQRQYDRSMVYAVDYPYSSNQHHPSYQHHQPSRHTSLEDISMQYIGFQPFGGIRSYDNVRPSQQSRDQYEYQGHWNDPSVAYW